MTVILCALLIGWAVSPLLVYARMRRKGWSASTAMLAAAAGGIGLLVALIAPSPSRAAGGRR